MKKIIAFLLIAVLAVSLLASCDMVAGSGKSDIETVSACYARSYPHKIVVESTQQVASQNLVSVTEIVRGMIGTDFVAKAIVNGEQLRSVEDGSGKKVYGHVETLKSETWFRVGKGTSEDKGETWDAEGVNFFPEKGAMALDLNADLMADVKFENGTLTFKVLKANTEAFFGEGVAVDADVSVALATAGGVVNRVTMDWVEEANLATGVDLMTVRIVADYIYDQQRVSMD